MGSIHMKLEPEFPAISQSYHHDFSILIQLKGRVTNSSKTHRQPLDLIAVLDISASMGRSRLHLLKKSMNFIIQNLTSFDRLSIVSFSKIATRNMFLWPMDPFNQTLALNAINSLTTEHGTNIAAGLKEAIEVFREDEMRNNVVRSIILFSDGQDNYTLVGDAYRQYDLLVPTGIKHGEWSLDQDQNEDRITIHTFGFGSNHDANVLCRIAERSGGTFSFIESEDKIQDSFALCVGGLISVVAKNIRLKVKCASGVRLSPIESGSYSVSQSEDEALINAGDLYGDEERRFMVGVHVPDVSDSNDEMTELLRVSCKYSDTVSNSVRSEMQEVSVQRPGLPPLIRRRSMDVDSETIRLRVRRALESARDSADKGLYGEAVERLTRASELTRSDSESSQMARLSEMLKQMQINVANKETYETVGRAYLMSELSSHSSQRSASSSGSFGPNTSMTRMLEISHSFLGR